MRSAKIVGIVLCAVVWTAGCGGGDKLPRERISGKVTLDGAALESGSIVFMPVDTTGAPTAVEASIQAGAYDVPARDGPIPGAYRVSISSPRPDGGAAAKGRPGDRTRDSVSGTGAVETAEEPPLRETIPAAYNAESTLKADVSRGGENVFDFPLKSK